ncbi:MAG: hypothetical protein JNM90_03615 [Burkholderiales bacterium]|nr:hypothetical protein [Burkholderiales bacterium]
MTDIDGRTGLPASAPLGVTHLIYALHAWTVVIGITTAAFVVTAFLFGWPSIVAVILNYVKRGAAAGTFLDSHFAWQIRTFWLSLMWLAIGGLAFVSLIGIPIGWLIWVLTGLWVGYRVVRGWIALVRGAPMPTNERFM